MQTISESHIPRAHAWHNRRRFLLFIFVVCVVVASLNYLALVYWLYWVLLWFDMVVHFLGGILVGLIGIFVFRAVRTQRDPDTLPLSGEEVLIAALSTGAVVGVGWELFEYVANLNTLRHYAIDTATDIIVDLLGVLTAYALLVHTRLTAMLD